MKTNHPMATIGRSRLRMICFIALIPGCLLSLSGTARAGAAMIPHSGAPYLIIHLDAIPSKLFFEEYDAGRLPNIRAAFEGGKIVRHAVSPFFPGTEMLYPRLKNGLGVTYPLPITWEMYNRESGEITTHMQTTIKLFSNLPKYSLTQIIHAIPGMDCFAGWALLNTPRMLDEYDIVEFFWFITDSYGHLFGEEAQKESMLILDEFFGLLMKQLKTRPVNMVLYADHGMSIFEQMYDAEAAISEVAQDNVRFLYYPNLYLKDQRLASVTARQLASREELDFVFYRADESRIVGVHKEGLVMFESDGDLIAYSYHGSDPFGYSKIGYDGQFLSDQQWVEMTCAERYPAVPVQVVRYMENPLSGDIVTILNPPKGLRTDVGIAGCHAGFVDTDCTVGVLMKGPDIVPSEIPDAFWLHEMYSKVLKIDPRNPAEARRDKHSLMVSSDGVELQLSPAHKRNTMLAIDSHGWTAIGETSVARSLITQIWAGLGITSCSELSGAPNPVASSRLNIYLGPLTYGYRNLILLSSGERMTASTLRLETECGTAVEWTHPNRIGFSISW